MNEPQTGRIDQDSNPALRRLGLALAAAAVLGGAAFFIWRSFSKKAPAAYVPKPVAPAEFKPAASALPAGIRFADITRAAGIGFVHHNGARGKKLLPETMGSGCAFLDFDRDGDQDLFFVNSASWPGDAVNPPPAQALYENDGAGHFKEVTREQGLAVTFYGMGCAVADTDADKWDDLFITALGGDRLFKNLEGKGFREVSREAGIPRDTPNTWSTSAAFLDYDNDGWLDLFVCRYIQWSPEIDLAQEFQITGLGRAYGPPTNFAGAFCRLYRNDRGRFEDVSAAAGIEVKNPLTGGPMAKALGVSVNDLDGDRFADLMVANDTVQNFLFHNRKDGSFEEIGVSAGIAFDPAGSTRGAMGIDWAVLDGRGAQAIVVGNFANEVTALYMSERPGSLPFTDDAIPEGIGNPSRKYMKFGVFFFDFDLDGRLDIFEANGHLEGEIQAVQAEQTYAQPAQLFWNASPGGRRGFEVMDAGHLGPDLFQPVVGRGCAYADIDGDGDLDLALTHNNGPARLFRNEGGNRNGWIRLKLAGKAPNTNALGAVIEADIGGETHRAALTSGRSYLSQCEQVITFGLGSRPRAEAVRLWWPGSKEPQDLGSIPSKTYRVIQQP
ncbi:MAG: CRTAC1 family protein [Planctomycetes bacterium]|nr:CRTAC1 family protein [Planctomycetota bacterium]